MYFSIYVIKFSLILSKKGEEGQCQYKYCHCASIICFIMYLISSAHPIYVFITNQFLTSPKSVSANMMVRKRGNTLWMPLRVLLQIRCLNKLIWGWLSISNMSMVQRSLRVSSVLLAYTFVRWARRKCWVCTKISTHTAHDYECIALVQRARRTSNKCWRTSIARQRTG